MHAFVLMMNFSQLLLWVRWIDGIDISKSQGIDALGWFTAVTGVIGGAIGGLLGGYFSKRGEIQAIHSQLDKVVAETSETRKATLNIDQDFWHRQRLWDLKRDIAIEMMKQVGALHEIVYSAVATAQVLWDNLPAPGTTKLIASAQEILTRYNECVASFYRISGAIPLVFSENVASQMDNVDNAARDAVRLVEQPFSRAERQALIAGFNEAKNRLGALVQEEMKKS
jgi:hypothetical protein